MMLDRKQIRAVFLFKLKVCYKAAETIHNINNAFGPETANKCIVQWWFKKFCKGVESLEDEECSDWSSEVDNDQLRAVIKADPLKTTQKIAKGLNVSHSIVVRHLKQIVKMKELNKWVPYELTTNCFLKVSSFLILHNSDPFLDQIAMCDEKWILCGHQLSGWIEKKFQSTSQSQTCTKNNGHCLLVCCLVLSLWLFESQQNHYI